MALAAALYWSLCVLLAYCTQTVMFCVMSCDSTEVYHKATYMVYLAVILILRFGKFYKGELPNLRQNQAHHLHNVALTQVTRIKPLVNE